jgi:hypothetical protein
LKEFNRHLSRILSLELLYIRTESEVSRPLLKEWLPCAQSHCLWGMCAQMQAKSLLDATGDGRLADGLRLRKRNASTRDTGGWWRYVLKN